MNLRHIENVIDSIDPYSLIKDMAIPILDESAEKTNNRNLSNGDKQSLVPNDFFGVTIKSKLIRILPHGFLNTRIYKDYSSLDYLSDRKQELFVAGTVIDFLAFFMSTNSQKELNYDEAFRVFFSYYSNYLKDKLYQEPAYIEKLVKPNFIKRQNILNFIVKQLFLADSYNTPTVVCDTWAARHGIQSLKGYGFYFSSKDVFNMLMYFNKNTIFDYYEQYSKNYQNGNLENMKFGVKVAPEAMYSDFINNHLFSESKEWVVIPYFSDFHIVSGIKFINPHDDTYYFIKFENDKLKFAGIYTIPTDVNFSMTKIRVMESVEDAATMASYANRMSHDDKLIYLAADFNPTGLNRRSNFNTWSKMMFLFQQNSNFPLIRALFDSIDNKNAINSDLYVCSYSNFQEDLVSYTYEGFVEHQFKQIIANAYQGLDNASAMPSKLSIDLDYFMQACNIESLSTVKANCLKWLKDNQFFGVYRKLTELKTEKVDFKGYSITISPNGYICEYKDLNNGDKIAITNFVFKIDQNIMYPENDDILHRGRLIMGDVEYPVSFYKSDLKKHGEAIEQIALKAFTQTTNGIVGNVQAESGYMMPVIFNPNFNNAIYTIIKHEITTAPSKYGISNIGWDKANNVFNSLSWQANALKISYKRQFIYSLSGRSVEKANRVNKSKDPLDIRIPQAINADLQKCFSNLPIKQVEGYEQMRQIPKCVREITGVLLSYLYRTYFGFNTIPFIVTDNLAARNLIRFLFSSLGQNAAYIVPPNSRLISSKTLLNGLNNYPIYLRCDGSAIDFVKNYPNSPYVLFLKAQEIQNLENNDEGESILDGLNLSDGEPFTINDKYTKEEYQKLAVFMQQTFDKFFKWMFSVGINEFELENQECTSQEQLLLEGSIIFRELWKEKMKRPIKDKTISPEEAFEAVIESMRLAHIRSCLHFYPEENCYLLKRSYLPEEAHNRSIPLLMAVKHSDLGGLIYENGQCRRRYVWINKEFVEKMLKFVRTADHKMINPEEDIHIFVSPQLADSFKLTAKYGTMKRTMTRADFLKSPAAEKYKALVEAAKSDD